VGARNRRQQPPVLTRASHLLLHRVLCSASEFSTRRRGALPFSAGPNALVCIQSFCGSQSIANLSRRSKFMTRKLLVLILALTVVSWAQTSNQTPPTDQQQSTEKAKCICCDKMASADSKDAKMCSRHGKHAKGAKASCCDGDKAMACCSKDGKSCTKDDKVGASCCENCGKDKTASACCGKDCKGGCCSKKAETAMNCCARAIHS
jgi:hypothetical protein